MQFRAVYLHPEGDLGACEFLYEKNISPGEHETDLRRRLCGSHQLRKMPRIEHIVLKKIFEVFALGGRGGEIPITGQSIRPMPEDVARKSSTDGEVLGDR